MRDWGGPTSKLVQVNETILVVEDEASIADFLTVSLTREGYRVLWARDGREALRLFRRDAPDAVLLDLCLPCCTPDLAGRSPLDGLEVLREIRLDDATSALHPPEGPSRGTPVLVVSVKNDEVDKVSALELGADDYVTKPFSARELIARIRANLRKTRPVGMESRVHFGALRIDWQRAEVHREDVRIFLTAREFEILGVLYHNRARVLTREQLLEKVWGHDFIGDDRVVDTTIKRLRKKIGAQQIETLRGLGYRLSEES